MSERLRVLELFSGIGGCATAIGERAKIVAAVDTDPAARIVYANNFISPICEQPAESLPTEWFREQAADVWWLSPPTLPYVHAGLWRELDDPRSNGLLHVIKQIELVKPSFVALTCVTNFNKSLTRQELRDTLTRSGYQWQELQLCPSDLGVPNKRPRYYLVAGLTELRPWKSPGVKQAFSLSSTLDATRAEGLQIAPELLAMHRNTMDVVDADDQDAITSTFTADYGRSVNSTGSYLCRSGRVSYFSPREIIRQLGFPESFNLPEGTSTTAAWRLVGNSQSIPATRMILDAIPGLMTRRSRLEPASRVS